ncbi:LysR substrate-binding domain-containing protein [Streptomyces sp. NPDC093065]|uniref:LysR substrate-binding domain-containing protein n=1 Tax=Streptomyces sp. NPDC093065 TaxID=3366021 RepID=UPI00380CBD64
MCPRSRVKARSRRSGQRPSHVIASVDQCHTALRQGVQLSDVADEPFIDVPAGSGQRQIVGAAFTEAELFRRVLIEVSGITTIADCVGHDLGVALPPPNSP